MNDFWSNLPFHVPNFILAAVMYTMMGRLALALFVPAGWDNYIFRAFVRITDPVLKVVRLVTPQALPDLIAMLFAVLWLLVIRVVFFIVMNNLGWAPTAGAQG
jgi:uncharacterized protein YggT (Ycf19 family)